MRNFRVLTLQEYEDATCGAAASYDRGVMTVTLDSWEAFAAIAQLFASAHDYVWRGERCSHWRLESSFDRSRRTTLVSREHRMTVLSEHLSLFQKAIGKSEWASDVDCWAYGQHQGLETPLLDWTEDPNVAAFFAFEGAPKADQTPFRVVYALNRELGKWRWVPRNRPFVEFLPRPSDGNARASAQKGLFTMYVDGNRDITSRVTRNYKRSGENRIVLAKIQIPNRERSVCLKNLDTMGISHLTLFPDEQGAAKFCNLVLELKASEQTASIG